MRVDRYRSHQHVQNTEQVQNNDSSSDVKYKAFNLGGRRGYTRVRYEAPEGKTQGKGGYYYGVTDDGEQVHVKGKKKVQEYKEFKPEGYDWIRVRYEAPEGKTQGEGGYYFGETDDNIYLQTHDKKEVSVMDKNRIKDYSASKIDKKRAVNFYQKKSILRTFVVNHKLEKKLMF
jgi:hypothetical protein